MRTEIKRGEAKLILENYFRNPLTRTIEKATFVAVVDAEKLRVTVHGGIYQILQPLSQKIVSRAK
jgi:hypothetical protein